jgi:predicted solute-binding protein
VSYLNSKPLVYGLSEWADEIDLIYDLPSRLADRLKQGDLDVALIPSVEYFRNPGYRIVSDACIGCRGPVLSVKLLSRRPMDQIRTLALDEGSRSSAVMVRILLKARFGLAPRLAAAARRYGLHRGPDSDAVLLIGDRAIHPPPAGYREIWDLGEQWCRWSGLPFVFAMWVARPGRDSVRLDTLLSAARDAGVANLESIARLEASRVGLTCEQTLATCATICISIWGLANSKDWNTFAAVPSNWARVPMPRKKGSMTARLLEKAVDGQRLSPSEGLELLETHDLTALGRAADAVARRLHPEPYRTYNIDRNINYTNICTAVCDFCAFYRKPKSGEGYVLTREQLLAKVEETVALGGEQILLQGGLHPEYDWPGTKRCWARSRAGSPRSTSTASARRRSITSPKSTGWTCAPCSSG